MARRPSGPTRTSGTSGRSVVRGREGGVFAKAYIRGGPEAARRLSKLAKDLSDQAMAQATLAGAEVIAEEWRRLVPVEDRDYQGAIATSASPGRHGATALVFIDDAPGLEESQQPRNYAPRLEFGSLRATLKTLKQGRTDFARRGRVARPSLRPAYDARKGEAIDAMAYELRHLIGKAT